MQKTSDIKAMNRTHKIRLCPNQTQTQYFMQACGIARFAYNWGLATWNGQYQEHVKDEINPSLNIFDYQAASAKQELKNAKLMHD